MDKEANKVIDVNTEEFHMQAVELRIQIEEAKKGRPLTTDEK